MIPKTGCSDGLKTIGALTAFTVDLYDNPGSPAYWTRSAALAAWTGDVGAELPERFVRQDFALAVTTAAITFTRDVAIKAGLSGHWLPSVCRRFWSCRILAVKVASPDSHFLAPCDGYHALP